MNDVRTTDYGKVRHLRRDAEGILSRGIHLNIICGKRNGELVKANEINYTRDC